MQVAIHFSHIASVTPKRCRKPRPMRFHDGKVIVNVLELTSADAPVALVATMPDHCGASAGMAVEYRWFNGNFYTSVRMSGPSVSPLTAGGTDWEYEPLPAVIDLRSESSSIRSHQYDLDYYPSEGASEIAKELRVLMRRHLIIDGKRFTLAEEPRYAVMTFGLSNNHGGTSLMVETIHGWGADAQRKFSLLQVDQAIAKATEVATARGDTKSLPISVNGPHYEILMPEVIGPNRPKVGAISAFLKKKPQQQPQV